jgi:hypothetical protein
MDLMTTGEMARRSGQDRDRVSYALRKMGIAPVGRAGLVRLYSEIAMEEVRTFLEAPSHRRARKEISPCQ